jgi:hypothetical protein
MVSDADPGCPRSYGSGCRSGTLFKSHKEVTTYKTEEIMGFLKLFLLDDGRIRSRIRTCD